MRRETSKVGNFGPPILGEGTPQIVAMRYQIWLTFEHVAKNLPTIMGICTDVRLCYALLMVIV